MSSVATVVPMAEIEVFRGAARFTCVGIGSCIALCALAPDTGVAGMAHILLPRSFEGADVRKPGRFADLAVRELLAMMERLGASRDKIVAAYAGGAQVLSMETGGNALLDIGARNALEVARQLESEGVRCAGHDVGGSLGRTITFDSANGEVRVRTVAQGDRPLCWLRG